jgi:hypothetical protein
VERGGQWILRNIQICWIYYTIRIKWKVSFTYLVSTIDAFANILGWKQWPRPQWGEGYFSVLSSRQHALTVQGLQSETESWSKTNGVVSRNWKQSRDQKTKWHLQAKILEVAVRMCLAQPIFWMCIWVLQLVPGGPRIYSCQPYSFCS